MISRFGRRRAPRRPRTRRTERVVVLSLSLFGAVWLLIALVTKPAGQGWDEWISSFAMNFASGIAGSLLTFLLIDLVLARQREEQSRQSNEESRRIDLLASLRRGTLEHNRGVVEQFKSAGWLRNGLLRDADFSGARLEGMDFEAADLQGALFVGAQLRRASFRGTNVSNARFTHADLRGARFDGARVDGTDFAMISQDSDTKLS